jgi:hypothetical protein
MSTPTTTYTTLLGSTQEIKYVAGASDLSLYPDVDSATVLGPLLLPRIYGKDLDALEIGSSGRIAFALNDQNAIDVTRSNHTNSSNFLNKIAGATDSDSLEVSAKGGKIVLDAAAEGVQLTATSNLGGTADTITFGSTAATTITAGDTFAASGALGASLASANSNVSVSAGHDVTVTAATGAAKVEASAGALTLAGNTGATLGSATGPVNVNAFTDVLMAADDSKLTFQMRAADDTVAIAAPGGVVDVQTSNVTMAATSAINASAPVLSGVFDTASISASNQISMTSAGKLILTAADELVLSATNLNLGVTGQSQKFTAPSNIDFFITGGPGSNSIPAFAVNTTGIAVQGDLTITGALNTSNINNVTVNQTTLKVNDKTIVVAQVDGDDPVDGLVNDAAGLMVDGLPTGFNSNVKDAYEKSILWRHGGGGVTALGAADYTNESYWDIRGGHMRLTHQKIVNENGKDVAREVAYLMRINDKDEMEFCKKHWVAASNAYVVRRIVRFGRTSA